MHRALFDTDMHKEVIGLPQRIAGIKLRSMASKLTVLTPEQIVSPDAYFEGT